MKCPACGRELTSMEVGGVTVDVCQGGCGGIWFDRYELMKFDEPHERDGEALLDVEVDPTVQVDASQRRECPRCPGIVMMRHFFSARMAVEVDECPQCGGYWLDRGELASIRELGTEEERREAAQKFFDEMFGRDMEAMRQESQERLVRARRVARIFKYLCPSYYIPGKQDWGAF